MQSQIAIGLPFALIVRSRRICFHILLRLFFPFARGSVSERIAMRSGASSFRAGVCGIRKSYPPLFEYTGREYT
jgi:hypothetical protein